MKTLLYTLQAITAITVLLSLYGAAVSPSYLFWTFCGITLFVINRRNIKDLDEQEEETRI